MGADRIYLSSPDVGDDEERAATGAVRSGWVAPIGPHLDEFERALAERTGRKHCVALASGTSGLHLGLIALGVQPGDFVICSTLTFVATANAARYVGAHPVFVDSDADTGNISVELLSEALSVLSEEGKTVGAVVTVDFLGAVAKYEEILPLCEAYSVPVLADAAESVGSTRYGRPSGSFGEAAVFSFNGNKVMTTSGGGALLTDDEDLATVVRNRATQARQNAWHYEHEDLGFNYRLSNVLASIGIAQLGRLDDMIARRRAHRRNYRNLFDGLQGVSVLGAADDEDNCWLSAILVDSTVTGFSTREMSDYLNLLDIETRPLWKPMHLQPLYQSSRLFSNGVSERLFQTGLALPSGSGLSTSDWARITSGITDFLAKPRKRAQGV